MKKDVSTGAIIAIVVVLVLIIGIAAYRRFGGDPGRSVATAADVQAAKAVRSRVMAPGVHRDRQTGAFLDANGNPVDLSVAPTKNGR